VRHFLLNLNQIIHQPTLNWLKQTNHDSGLHLPQQEYTARGGVVLEQKAP
jgi:hypothetical protein